MNHYLQHQREKEGSHPDLYDDEFGDIFGPIRPTLPGHMPRRRAAMARRRKARLGLRHPTLMGSEHIDMQLAETDMLLAGMSPPMGPPFEEFGEFGAIDKEKANSAVLGPLLSVALLGLTFLIIAPLLLAASSGDRYETPPQQV